MGCTTCGGSACADCCPTYEPRPAYPAPDDYTCTLVGDLVPLADDLRQLEVGFGFRPYQLHRVHTAWSGGRRGVGTEQVVSDVAIVPVPLVLGIGDLQHTVLPIGGNEDGSGVTVKEISGTYTEAFLRGLGPNGESIPSEQNFYYEVTLPRGGSPGVRRRFTLRSVPEWKPGEYGWTFKLTKANEDRRRNGDPST